MRTYKVLLVYCSSLAFIWKIPMFNTLFTFKYDMNFKKMVIIQSLPTDRCYALYGDKYSF